MRNTSLILLFTVWALAGARVARAESRDWVEVESPDFTVVSDVSPHQVLAVARRFERIRAVFQKAFPQMRVYPQIPVVILAARNARSFQSLQPAAWQRPGEVRRSGLLLRNSDKNYILLQLGLPGNHPYRVIYHEYAHLILEDNFRSIPLWLNEGLAQFYANSDVSHKTVRLGLPSNQSLQLLRDNNLLPLPLLFTVTNTSPYYNESTAGTIFYAESWALTDYLMFQQDGAGRGPINEYLALAAQGQDPVSAARQAFGGLDALQSKLQSFVHSLAFHYYRLKVSFSGDGTTWPVRKLSAGESAAIRGGFLVRVARYSEARTLLQEALNERDPERSVAQSMGLLELRTGNAEQAAVWFARAARQCPQCYLARFYHAVQLLRTGPTPDESRFAIGELRAFIQFNPVSAPPYTALAVFYAQHHEHLAEACQFAKQASQLDPGHLPYLFLEGQIFLEMGNAPAALRVAQRAVQQARSPQEKSQAYIFLGTLQQR